MRRYLQWQGYEVTYVQNFTDIDDKILKRAQQEGVSMADISERFIKAYFADIRPLNVMDADEYPRVTNNIAGIQQLIQVLLEKTMLMPWMETFTFMWKLLGNMANSLDVASQ